MSDLFLTNPGSFEKRKTYKRKSYIDLKEEVEYELQELGIPFYYARTAVIDLKSAVISGYHNKTPAVDIAREMLDDVRKAYNV